MKHANKTIQYSIYDLGGDDNINVKGASGTSARFVLDTTSIKRPSLESLTETMTGAGIAGEIDVPTLGQFGAMSYEISYKRTNKDAVKLFGQKVQHIETRWATDVLDSATGKINICANKEIVKGIPKKLDLGGVENNTANETTAELEIIYYKFIQNGETLIEIDKLNNVVKLNGVDYTAELRAAL